MLSPEQSDRSQQNPRLHPAEEGVGKGTWWEQCLLRLEAVTGQTGWDGKVSNLAEARGCLCLVSKSWGSHSPSPGRFALEVLTCFTCPRENDTPGSHSNHPCLLSARAWSRGCLRIAARGFHLSAPLGPHNSPKERHEPPRAPECRKHPEPSGYRSQTELPWFEHHISPSALQINPQGTWHRLGPHGTKLAQSPGSPGQVS